MSASVIFQGSNFFGVEIGYKQYFFSYDTCVAFADLKERIFIRRESNYSKTTAKHLRMMGVLDWQKVSDDEFEANLE